VQALGLKRDDTFSVTMLGHCIEMYIGETDAYIGRTLTAPQFQISGKITSSAVGVLVVISKAPADKYRVRTVMENLEKSWHFKMVISRPGKVLEKTYITKGLEKSWKFVIFTCSFTSSLK